MKARALFFSTLLLTSSCGFKTSSSGSHTGNIISGIISPFVGSIVENNSSSLIISSATASLCADPVYAKLFALENDGSIDENNPIVSQLVGADARYSFDIKSLGIAKPTSNVQFLVKAEGCNGDVYKRPITNFDSKQSVDAKSTVIAEVINASSLITKKLNQVSRNDIELLINSVSGSSTSAALNSLTSETSNSTRFTEIFGASPSVIHDSSPEVKLVMPLNSINELAVSNFSIQAFHVDPSYSFAYSWKIDGIVKSTSASWSYIPGANESGAHTINLYVGKNDGSGNIDLSKPYYTKSAGIIVNNNMLPIPPNLAINASTPNPRNTNSVSIDLSTGVSLANCATFSHLAITDTPSTPGIMQFNIDCTTNGSQTENITFSSGDGAKTLYLWAIDNEGNISTPKTVSLVLDSLPPVASINYSPTVIKGGTGQTITLSASDAGVGLSSLNLYFSTDGGSTYSLVSNLATTASTYSWSSPSIDTVNGKLKLVATDFTSSATIIYSSSFAIDSTAPIAPAISRTSNAIANSTSVSLSATCTVDYDKILYSQTGTTPSLSDSAWENCASTKNFTVSTGDGLKTIYAFTRDSVGNISSSSNVTMTFDTTLPNLSISNFNSGGYFQGGSSQNITWSAADTNLSSTPISISYSTDGSTYTAIVSNIANSGTYSWTLPSINSATVTLKITASDLAGNVKTIISNDFVIDSAAPTVAVTDPTGPVRGGNTITLNYSASDTNTISTLKLYFAADGVTYGSATNLTVGSTTYSWSAPSLNVSTAKIKIEATDNVGNVGAAISNAFTIDSAAPSAPTIARTSNANSNSNAVTISVTCTADYDKILYSQTGTTPILSDSAWENCASTKNFIANTGDGVKTIYAFVRDTSGNISSSSNITMTLDTTPPASPVANLASASISSSSATTFTVTDCLDRPFVLVSESMIAPVVSDLNWQTCSTSAGAITYTLTGPILQGTHTLYVYAKDAVGNVSASTSASMIYDTTNPTLSLSTVLGSLYKGGDTIALNFSASDTNGLSSLRLEYAADGSTYSLVTSLATSATTYTWTVPADNTTTAKIRLVAKDNATIFNSTTVASTTFTIDSTAPTAPTIARSSAQYSSSNSVTINTTCVADYYQIFYTQTASTPSLSDSNWEICGATKTFITTTGEGLKTIYAFTRDTAGNISSSSNITMTLDTILPTLSLSSFNSGGYFQGGSLQNITWSASDANLTATPISISYSTNGSTYTALATNIANSGTYAWTLPSIDSSTVTLKIIATDLAGNNKTITSSSFTIENSNPILSSFSITEGANTSVQNIRINLTASSSVTKITHFCIKVNSTSQPTSNDSCWKAVDATPPGITQATSIAISNFYYQLGFTSGNYALYGFVKNQNGLISTLSNSGAGTNSTDTASTYFTSPQPPVVANVIASNTDAPSNPINSSEYIISAGANVYIKWKATDSIGFGANPITIEYTTNGTTYTQIVTNLLNGSNGSCSVDSGSTTLDDGNTGCYVWSGTSLGTYFAIRVRATNSGSVSSSAQSAPMNSGNINIIAGNIDMGIDGSAKSAIISFTNGGAVPKVQQFVVMPDGKIIILDKINGVALIDPTNGRYTILIKNGAANSNEGDGGSVSLAKVKAPAKIILGYDNNLYVWDSERVRKITTSSTPWTINTVIGGGGTVSGASVTGTSLQLFIPAVGFNPLFSARPDGTIWFIPNNFGNALNHAAPPTLYSYSIANGVATKIGTFTGIGDASSSSRDLLASGYGFYSGLLATSFDNISSNTLSVLGCISNSGGSCGSTRFNTQTLIASPSDPDAYPYASSLAPTASMVVGMDGKIYSVDSRGWIFKWNDSNSTTSTIFGNGYGYCSDGTTALACKNSASDLFVSPSGKYYWYESGMIRTLDNSGNIVTLAGQNNFYGDGLSALNARFGTISSIAIKSNGNVVALDKASLRIREFNRASGVINLLAGNGANAIPNTTSLADAQAIPLDVWVDTYLIGVLPATDEVVYNRGNAISKISSSTGKWVDIAGNGSTSYTSADGLALNAVKVQLNYYPKVIGINTSSVLVSFGGFSSGFIDGMLKTYSIASGLQSGFAGLTGVASANWPGDGSTLSTSLFPHSTYIGSMSYDSTNSNWIAYTGSNSIKTLTQGGTLANLFTDSGTTAIRSVTSSRASGHLIVYYCALVSSNYQLKKWDQSTSTITTLSWPSTSISCLGNGLAYDSSSSKLIFSFQSNGLQGIAEYLSP